MLITTIKNKCDREIKYTYACAILIEGSLYLCYTYVYIEVDFEWRNQVKVETIIVSSSNRWSLHETLYMFDLSRAD